MTETVVNWVVVARKQRGTTRPWLTMSMAGSEEGGRAQYASWLASKAAKGFAIDYRLVKRTAVITEEILEEG